jgi:hypothetical protein
MGLKATNRHARSAAVYFGMLMAALLAIPTTAAAQANRKGVRDNSLRHCAGVKMRREMLMLSGLHVASLRA